MSDQDIWQHLEKLGNIRPLWWYTVAVTPAMLVAASVYLIVLYVLLRRRDRLASMLMWLSLASLPLLLIMPSLYARMAIGDGLANLGLARPTIVQDFNFESVQEIGRDLSQLAWLGIAGALLALVLLVVSLIRSGVHYVPPLQRRTENPATRTNASEDKTSGVMTEAFERHPNLRASAPYGVLRIVTGQRKGTQFGITGSLVIGKQRADLTINDSIVSRRHARIDISDGAVSLTDLDSQNGTYLSRNGALKDINGQPLQLQAGDLIFLGNPDLAQAVQLLYETGATEDGNPFSGSGSRQADQASNQPDVSA